MARKGALYSGHVLSRLHRLTSRQAVLVAPKPTEAKNASKDCALVPGDNEVRAPRFFAHSGGLGFGVFVSYDAASKNFNIQNRAR